MPHLEDWIQESTRSESAIIDSVLLPQIGEEITGREIAFQWRMSANVPVSLRILDNHEEELLTLYPNPAQLPMMTVRVKTSDFKEPGLFYWKIEDKNDVFFVGKFLFLGKPQPRKARPQPKATRPPGVAR